MKRKQTRDFLIRNIPFELFRLLEESAKEHNRTKTQEAIVALATGLSIHSNRIRQPKPCKWRGGEFLISLLKEPSIKVVNDCC
jgi:hypothetical protein